MSNQILIVVDMQNDFITGSLGSEAAKQILPYVVEKIRSFNGDIFFTMDTHDEDYLESQEGKMLPVVHCIEGTKGWQLADEIGLLPASKKGKAYTKNGFLATDLMTDLLAIHETEGIASIELVGLCTDICVVCNALACKGFLPDVPISVDSLGCAGITPAKHEAALETMRSCQVLVK